MVLSLWRRDSRAAHLFAFLMSAALITVLMSPLMLWPLHLLLPLGGYGILVLAVPSLRGSVTWLKRGAFDSTVWILVVLSAVAGLVGLGAWVALTRPNLDILVSQFPHVPVWLLPFAGLGFATVNACLEEGVFRGIVQDALTDEAQASRSAIVLQAALFGLLHFREGAFPHGVIGVLMTAAYGSLLGLLRHRSGGLAAPCLAHGLADLVVFMLVGVAAVRGLTTP